MTRPTPRHRQDAVSLLDIALVGAVVVGLAACQPEEQRLGLDDWRLGTFEMTWNGERLEGNLSSISRNVAERDDPEADADFSFTEHSSDLYEQRHLLFTIKCKVGHYAIDTIRPAGTYQSDWPHAEVTYYHDIEHGHISGANYNPILRDTIADFIAVDSIVGGVYHGRFQVSLASWRRDTTNLPHAPDTIVIRDGRFAVREYISG